MNAEAPACFIGLDMGTTNTRAWLVVEGSIVRTLRAAAGARDTAVAGSADALRRAVVGLVRELTAEAPATMPPRVAIAAGMITSAQGLVEVPHLPAPAGLPELAAGLERHALTGLEEMRLFLVPGVRTGAPDLAPPGIGSADVMRGEETLFLGLAASGLIAPGETLLSLGSHWKLIRADEAGRVAGSVTLLSGELLHAAQERTVLSASLPGGRPENVDLEWARHGAREARASGLERALFCVRLLHQRSVSTPEQRLSFAAGAFVGSALPHLLGALDPAGGLVVAGGAGVAEIAAATVRDEGGEARVLSAEQVEQGMVRGLAAIAGAAGLGGGG